MMNDGVSCPSISSWLKDQGHDIKAKALSNFMEFVFSADGKTASELVRLNLQQMSSTFDELKEHTEIMKEMRARIQEMRDWEKEQGKSHHETRLSIETLSQQIERHIKLKQQMSQIPIPSRKSLIYQVKKEVTETIDEARERILKKKLEEKKKKEEEFKKKVAIGYK